MRALLSVSDKSKLDHLAFFLKQNDVEIVSSGGTRKYIEGLGLEVTPIEKVTGNPEAFGGRMKTLSFQVASGLLFRRNFPEDVSQAQELGIQPIDIVVCNLYPFAAVKEKGGTWEELIDNIDIGGPTLIRAGAKNYSDVWSLTSPEQYEDFVSYFKHADQELALTKRKNLARQAFAHCASYDSLIAQTFAEDMSLPQQIVHVSSADARETRYGENPHQKGWVWGNVGLAGVTPLQGKELSYNNYLDADAAWRSLSDIHHCTDERFHYGVTVIKHSNPCGAALAATGLQALEKAWAGDQVSAFGSIIACNGEVDEDMAKFLTERFVEVVMAPMFSDSALELFKNKKNVRLLKMDLDSVSQREVMVRTINGGYLLQEEDELGPLQYKSVTNHAPDCHEQLLRFGQAVTKHLKSNAIALVREQGECYQLVGAGMGNPNRLVSLEQAVDKARENEVTDLSSCLLISDAFFPFRDNIDLAAKYGVKAIVQPGGSIKDQEVIDACNEHGIHMMFTGTRHFRH